MENDGGWFDERERKFYVFFYSHFYWISSPQLVILMDFNFCDVFQVRDLDFYFHFPSMTLLLR